MDPEQKQFLSLPQPPARLNPVQAAWFLGFHCHEIPILVATGLLRPLGNPPANGIKYFAASELNERRLDIKWLSRASDAIYRHWQKKNARQGRVPRLGTRQADVPAKIAV